MLNLTPTGRDLRKTWRAATMWVTLLPDMETDRAQSKWISGLKGGRLNLGTSVAMRARWLGRVGWVSRTATGLLVLVATTWRTKSAPSSAVPRERVADAFCRDMSAPLAAP